VSGSQWAGLRTLESCAGLRKVDALNSGLKAAGAWVFDQLPGWRTGYQITPRCWRLQCVELRRFELLTSSMRTKRSTN
jgi:hypothetical protein